MIDLSKCTYRGEGNNNIVLANNEGIIYRVRKNSSFLNLPNKKNRAFKKKPNLSILFGQHRMTQCFGVEFLSPMYTMDVDSSLLEKIACKFAHERPVFRLERNVDIRNSRISVAQDATKMPIHLATHGEGSVLCVEIKPKFGAILQNKGTRELDDIKRQNAMYCMMQFHKSKRLMWDRRSSYCPCDLFSGNRIRMRKSIHALIQVPQNNMRVFLNSKPVLNNEIDNLNEALRTFFHKSESKKFTNHSIIDNQLQNGVKNKPVLPNNDADIICSSNDHTNCISSNFDPLRLFVEKLLIDALLLNWSSSTKATQPPSTFRYDCQLHSSIEEHQIVPLPTNSVLGRIFFNQLQSSLGHAEIIQHFNRVQAFFEANHIQWKSFIAGTLNMKNYIVPESVSQSLLLVEKHLVAMVARDCSLMISFQRAKSDCPDNVKTIQSDCLCSPIARTIVNITVVDLDPKTLTNLLERDEKEYEAMQQFKEQTGFGDRL